MAVILKQPRRWHQAKAPFHQRTRRHGFPSRAKRGIAVRHGKNSKKIDKEGCFVMIRQKQRTKMDPGKATPTTILNELSRAVKMHNFYPTGHPHFRTALAQCVGHIKDFVTETEEVKYTISPRGFEFRSKQVGADSKDISELAKKCFLRKIRELTITWRVREEEIKELVEVLRMEPGELSEAGGIERVFAERGVEGLLLNEMRYEDLKRMKAESQIESHEADPLAVDPGAEDLAVDETEGDKIIQPKSEGGGSDEALSDMIEKIRVERDFLRFNDLSVRIKERCSALISINALGEVVPAVLVFHELSCADSPLPKDLTGMARTQLKGLLHSEPLLRYLAGRAGDREEVNRDAIQQCLLLARDNIIDILLDDAVQAPEATVRRNIFNTLLLFDKRLLPFITERIKRGVWYEVRQMAALLGEIGERENVRLLEEIYGHENVKVKKEALKSLARIPSRESSEILRGALAEEDTSLVTQAIVSLGCLRDASAIDAISEMALKWEPFARDHNIQKEAIKALGNIGSAASTGTLTRILMRKSWFSREDNEELRELAARSLGMIGDEEACKALKKAMKKSEGALYATCKRVLEGKDGKAENV